MIQHPALELSASLSGVCRIAHALLRDCVWPKLGRFEYSVTATALAMLAVRHAEGAATCSQLGPSGYSPMASCARAAFETGVLSVWLLNAPTDFEREGRWLGYYKANSRYWRNLAKDFEQLVPEIAHEWRGRADIIDQWRERIEEKLPSGQVVDRPSFAAILSELGLAPYYSAYRDASQIVHGEPPSLELVARSEYTPDAGEEGKSLFRASSRRLSFGDFVTGEMWANQVMMASFASTQSCVSVSVLVDAPADRIEGVLSAHDRLLNLAENLRTRRDTNSGTGKEEAAGGRSEGAPHQG